MTSSPPTHEPTCYQIWVATLVYGLPVLLILSLLPIGFPIERPETALALFPKLAANAICVESLRGAVARDAYVLRYANLAIWAGIFGVLLGLTLRRANRGVWGAVVPTDRTKGQRLMGRLLAMALLAGLFGALPWWVVFHGSACKSIWAGIPEYRAFQGAVPAVLLAGPGSLAGLLLDGLWRGLFWIWRRLAMVLLACAALWGGAQGVTPELAAGAGDAGAGGREAAGSGVPGGAA